MECSELDGQKEAKTQTLQAEKQSAKVLGPNQSWAVRGSERTERMRQLASSQEAGQGPDVKAEGVYGAMRWLLISIALPGKGSCAHLSPCSQLYTMGDPHPAPPPPYGKLGPAEYKQI